MERSMAGWMAGWDRCVSTHILRIQRTFATNKQFNYKQNEWKFFVFGFTHTRWTEEKSWTSYRVKALVSLKMCLKKSPERCAVRTNYIHIWDHLMNCSMIVCEFNALKRNSSSSSSGSPRAIYVVFLYFLLIWSDFQLCDAFLLHYFSLSFFENMK